MASAFSNKVVVQLPPNREVNRDSLNGVDGTVLFGTFVENIVSHCNLFFIELMSQRQESVDKYKNLTTTHAQTYSLYHMEK